MTRRVWRRLHSVPSWAWLAVAVLILLPWWLRYLGWVLGGPAVEFLAPVR